MDNILNEHINKQCIHIPIHIKIDIDTINIINMRIEKKAYMNKTHKYTNGNKLRHTYTHKLCMSNVDVKMKKILYTYITIQMLHRIHNTYLDIDKNRQFP